MTHGQRWGAAAGGRDKRARCYYTHLLMKLSLLYKQPLQVLLEECRVILPVAKVKLLGMNGSLAHRVEPLRGLSQTRCEQSRTAQRSAVVGEHAGQCKPRGRGEPRSALR